MAKPIRLTRAAPLAALAALVATAGCEGAAPDGSRPGTGTGTGSGSGALTLHVPGDAATIQAAIDASSQGDTVDVAAGDYVESLVIPDGVSVVGAGPALTVLHGRVSLGGAGCRISGLRVTATGAVGLPAGAVGIQGDAPSGIVSGNVVDGFAIGIRLAGSEFAAVTGNRVQRNGVGIETFEAGPVLIANNLVLNNTRAGVRLESGEAITVVQNTIVGNGFGEPLASGGAGIAVIVPAGELVQNNVLVSNGAGINALGASGTHDHNLVWGNVSNYAGSALAGAGDLSVDPLFADFPGGDFHLRAGSPAIDAGLAGLSSADFDGLPRPEGAAADLGAFERRAPASGVRLVISEVLANPVDENRGELVEIVNLGAAPVDLAGAFLSDGDARDVLVATGGGTTIVAPGAYAVILDPDYVSGYGIPVGTTLLNPGNSTVGNGLSAADPITLYAADGVTVLASFEHPFDPGNGVSAERVDLEAADSPSNWRASPCLQSAGRPNCAPVTLARGLVVSEVMANPLDEATGEFIELFNGGDVDLDVAGMSITDGTATDLVIGWRGGSTVIPPRSYAVVLDKDWPDNQLFRIDPTAVLLSVADAALGNGLAMADPVSVVDGTGAVVDSYARTLIAANGRSIEKVSLSAGDAPGNWAQSSCADGSSPGSLNCVSGATAGPRKPLAITEVMSNPLEEDTGEFVELYNRGVDPVDAEGLLLTDGDATDRLTGFAGGSAVIPAGGYAVILDAEYAGEYAIPPEAVRLTTMDTTLGSGLAIDDPLRLLEANGVEVIDTFRFPFNPGNGISAERIDLRAYDSAANWTASTCATHSSPGANNCAASAAGLPKRVRITEVMSNQAGTEAGGAGEFVELFNAGSLSVDLAGMYLESGPIGGAVARDLLGALAGGSTILAPGAHAVALDPDYDGRYTFPAGTVLVQISDTNFGSSGFATTHGVTLYDADGITALDLFRFPSDPGDGISLYRISLSVVDSAANWGATPCGASPGNASCPGSADTTTYTSFWADWDGSESGHFWVQAIGWPVFARGDCEMLIVCTGGLYPYAYRDNLAAPTSFSFTNPYPDRPIVFTERASTTDACVDPCLNASVTVDAGATVTIPASSLGYYYAESAGPRLNAFAWYDGDPARYWALPPDGTLAPFTVEVGP